MDRYGDEQVAAPSHEAIDDGTGTADGDVGSKPTPAKRAARFLKQLNSPDRKIALLEQGMLAGVRLAAMVSFARIMPRERFGAFALVVSISFILNNAQRSAVILPFIVSCQKAPDPRRVGADWWWLDLAGAAVAATLLTTGWAIAYALGARPWVQTALLCSALAAPPLMTYTFMRRWCYQFGAYRVVFTMLAANILTYSAGIAAAWVAPNIAALPFVAFAAGPTAGVLVGFAAGTDLVSRPSARLFRTWWTSVRFTTWAFLSFLCGSVYTHGMNLLTAGMLGAAGSGMFSASRTFVAPIVSLITAVDMIDKPRAGRAFEARGFAGLHRSIRGTLATLLVLGTPYLIIVTVFSEPALRMAYGAKYLDLETEVRLWALAMFLQMVSNPLVTHLVTLADSRSIFICSAIAASVAIAIAVPLFAHVGVAAALAGMIGGRLVNLALLVVATRRHRPRDHIVGPEAGDPEVDIA